MLKLFLWPILSLLICCSFLTAYSFADNFGIGVWRFASEHEYGDLEPGDFCYIAIKGNNILMHFKGAGDPETVSVYRINKGNSKNFCATKQVEYEPNDNDWSSFSVLNDKETFESNKHICGKVKNNKLILENWITLEWKEAYVHFAFPEKILRRHYK